MLRALPEHRGLSFLERPLDRALQSLVGLACGAGRSTSTHIAAAALGALLALGSPHVLADPVDSANAVRLKGCPGSSGARNALRPNRRLNDVARRLARGDGLREALSAAGYRAIRSASMVMTGEPDDRSFAATLSSRFCEEITDPAFREVGVFVDDGSVWLVAALPFSAPAPKEAQAVSRRVLELVNEARSQGRRCGGTSFAAAPPLSLSDTLAQAALAHARDMASHSNLSHQGSDGSTPAQRAGRAGYKWRLVGENVAAGPTTAEEVTEGWLESPAHCSNIMEPRFTELGVAYAVDSKSTAGIYWAQVFGLPR